MSDIITAENLQLWYGDTHALKGIDMAIPEKNITALIGPSGCGKSTFLKTLNRMNDLIPSVRITGEVRYNGRAFSIRTWTCAPCGGTSAWCSKSRIPSP